MSGPNIINEYNHQLQGRSSMKLKHADFPVRRIRVRQRRRVEHSEAVSWCLVWPTGRGCDVSEPPGKSEVDDPGARMRTSDLNEAVPQTIICW